MCFLCVINTRFFLNVDKTKYVLIINYRNPFTFNPNIILNFKEMEKADYIKFLGVTINTTLN